VVIVQVVAGTLLVLPLAGLGRRIGGDRAGLLTAAVVAIGPALTTLVVNRGAGSEAVYTLLVASAVWFAVAARSARLRRALAGAAAAGGTVGLAYLARPEGLLFSALLVPALVLGAIGGWKAIRARAVTRSQVGRAALLGGAFTAALLVPLTPYVSYLHDKTGQWQLTAKTHDTSIEAWRYVAEGDRPARDSLLYEVDEETGLDFVAEQHTLPELARNEPGKYLAIVGVNIRTLFDVSVTPDLKGPIPHWEVIPVALLALGFWAVWRNWRNPTAMLVFAASGVPVLTALIFFVQPRYLIPAAAFMCVLVGVGLAQIPVRWRAAAWSLAAVLLLTSTAAGFYGSAGWWHPREHVEHRIVGKWLNDHTEPDDKIMNRSMVIEFYAERSTVAVPYADNLDETLRFARYYGADYLVADEYFLEWVRPQLHELWEPGPWEGVDLVHEFETEGRTTRVFRVVGSHDRENRDAPDNGYVGDSNLGQ
jgi:hypothetical protein